MAIERKYYTHSLEKLNFFHRVAHIIAIVR